MSNKNDKDDSIKEEAAFNKGERDSKHAREMEDKQGVVGHALSEFVRPSYQPPKDEEDAYREGWRQDREQSKRS